MRNVFGISDRAFPTWSDDARMMEMPRIVSGHFLSNRAGRFIVIDGVIGGLPLIYAWW